MLCLKVGGGVHASGRELSRQCVREVAWPSAGKRGTTAPTRRAMRPTCMSVRLRPVHECSSDTYNSSGSCGDQTLTVCGAAWVVGDDEGRVRFWWLEVGYQQLGEGGWGPLTFILGECGRGRAFGRGWVGAASQQS